MGAYLQKPITHKDSFDDINEFLACGASSMQGWRNSQEDAHNCILNFDKRTSFFAVYDGHGGSEVAIYCSKYLPDILKESKEYKNGNIEEALKQAYLVIDANLLKEEVIEELKVIATSMEEKFDAEAGEEEDEDLDKLCKEGQMPLNEVLQQYKQKMKMCDGIKAMLGDSCSSHQPGGSKNQSGVCSAGNSKLDTCPSLLNQSEKLSNCESAEETYKKESDINEPKSETQENDKEIECGKHNSSLDDGDKKEATTDESIKTIDNNKDKETKTLVEEKCVNGMPELGSNDECEPSESSSKSPLKSKNLDECGSSVSGSTTASNGTLPKRSKPKIHIDSSDDSEEEMDTSYEAVASSSDDDEEGEEELEFEDDTEYDEEEEEEGEEVNDDEESTAFMESIMEEPGKDSGCTAVVALLHGNDLYVANAGDSRCVVCRNGKALDMSQDHKPEDEVEHTRIKNAGGKVTLDGRVNGGLNLSRAIGDHAYKRNDKLPPEEQMISALPDIKKISISKEDNFMILACDGIWNSMSSEVVVEFISAKLKSGSTRLSEICENLFEYCLAPDTMGDGTGCDNMTAIIVKFKHKETGEVEIEDVVAKKRSASVDDIPDELAKRIKVDEEKTDAVKTDDHLS